MKCCFCGGDAGKYGNDPCAIYWGGKKRRCDKCHLTYVIPARLGARAVVTKIQEVMKEEGC